MGEALDRLQEKVELTTRIWIPPYPNPIPGGDPIVDGHWRDIESYDDLDAAEEGAVRRSGGPKTIGGYPPLGSALQRLLPRPEPAAGRPVEQLERKATPFHSTRPVPMKMYGKGTVARDAEGHAVVLRDDGIWTHVDPEDERLTGKAPPRVQTQVVVERAPPVQVHPGLPSPDSPPGQLQFEPPPKPKPKPRVRRAKTEPAIIAGPNPGEMREAIAVGNERFLRHNRELGGGMNAPGPIPTDKLMAISSDEVTPEQRVESEKLIAKFMANPSMQPYFEQFGRPTFLVAARTFDGNDPRTGGKVEGEVGVTRPGAVLAAWRAGVVTVYAPTSGDTAWLKRRKIPIRGTREPKVSGGPGSFYRPEITSVMDWSGRDAVLRHEYGHQVIFQAFDTERPDGASDAFGGRGGKTVVDGFFRAMFGKGRDEVYAEIDAAGGRGKTALPPDLNRELNRSLIPISTYATLGGIHEAAAEAFAVVTDPRYKRETSPYPPEAQRVLDFVEDLVK